jgi:OOP family OmpA-OmpF porin
MGREVVTLLPDPGTGAVGRAIVSNASGSVELAAARASTVVIGKQAPAAATTLSEAAAKQLEADAFAALPPAALHFTLNFKFDSDDLTDQSRALLPEVLRAVRGRPSPEVLVIGHTDTVGSSVTNIAIGLRRAEMIRRQLIDIGLAPRFIDATSHGEADLLVPTADDVREPRNRRVEISVR